MSSDLKHDDEFWYTDGSIVLAAGDRAFRVYHGILTQESEVFRDLLSVPQPQTVETFEGCPLVRLADPFEALSHLLRFLFKRCDYGTRKESVEFCAIASLVRLGHKYRIEAAETEGLDVLKAIFPSSLKLYKARDFINPRAHHEGLPAYMHPVCTIAAVNLADITGTNSILPAALYDCCLLPADELAKCHEFPGCGSREQLSLRDFARCYKGRATLFKEEGFIGLRII